MYRWSVLSPLGVAIATQAIASHPNSETYILNRYVKLINMHVYGFAALLNSHAEYTYTIYTYAYMHTHTCTCTHTCMHTHTHAHTHACTHTHMHTHTTHTHTLPQGSLDDMC